MATKPSKPAEEKQPRRKARLAVAGARLGAFLLACSSAQAKGGTTIGQLTLKPFKGNKIEAAVSLKRGRVMLGSSADRLELLKKTKLKLSAGKLELKRLPKLRLKRVEPSIHGRHVGMLRNPQGCANVIFPTTIKPRRGETIEASASVKLHCGV